MDCIRCKGRVDSRFACGRDFCPIYARSKAMFRTVSAIDKEEFRGTSPSVFVGHYGYPKVNVGILSSSEHDENAHLLDAPRQWAEGGFVMERVVELRSSLINSRFGAEVRSPSRNLGLAQEIAMSSRPVDVDVRLLRKPEPRMSFSNITPPMGPSAPLKSADLASNPKVSGKVEKMFCDTDLKSSEAVRLLYSHGFGENELSRMLSVGVFGVKGQRRLVPTRWSITATDDLLAKDLLRGIRSCSLAGHQLFHGSLYGNYYFIMFFPDVWSYELFEGYMPRSAWNMSRGITFVNDYEPYGGRKHYADNTTGGYYAARLPIVEKLREMGRQASVLVIRFVTDEYACPLGVFVCREAVRKSLKNPVMFSSKDEMLGYAKEVIRKMFGFDVAPVFSQSRILKEARVQTKLSSYSPEPDSD